MSDKLYEDIINAMKILGTECIPSDGDLKSINMSWLSSRIQKCGGFKYCSKKYSIPNKSWNRTEWTDKLIKERIMEVVNKCNLDRMPSRNEVSEYYHNGALTAKISRNAEWYKLAEELRLPVKESETLIGKTFESFAEIELQKLGYCVKRMSQNFPYDLFVNNCLKVDVKASKLYRGINGNFYAYNLEKPFCTCDIYILYLLYDDMSVKDALIIPSKFVPQNTQISVGENNSKYYKYINQWHYIKDYCNFFQGVA